jgi:hypothetical protein
LPAYEPVAASKHAGELAVRGFIPMLAAKGVRLLAATGDLIEGTITAKLLERAAPGLAVARGATCGRGRRVAAPVVGPATCAVAPSYVTSS